MVNYSNKTSAEFFSDQHFIESGDSLEVLCILVVMHSTVHKFKRLTTVHLFVFLPRSQNFLSFFHLDQNFWTSFVGHWLLLPLMSSPLHVPDHFQRNILFGFAKNTRLVVSKSVLCYLGCVLRFVVLLEN